MSAVALMATLLPAAPAQADPSMPATNGLYELYVNFRAGKCIHATGTLGEQLYIVRCFPDPNANNNQYWAPSLSSRICCGYTYHRIVNRSLPWLCIGVVGGSTAKGAPVVQVQCAETDDQYWAKIFVGWSAKGAAIYIFANFHSGKCLRVAGASQLEFARLVQDPCDYDGRHWVHTTNY